MDTLMQLSFQEIARAFAAVVRFENQSLDFVWPEGLGTRRGTVKAPWVSVSQFSMPPCNKSTVIT